MRSTRRHITTKTINLPPLDRRVIEFNVGRKLHRKQLQARASSRGISKTPPFQSRYMSFCVFAAAPKWIYGSAPEWSPIDFNKHAPYQKAARARTYIVIVAHWWIIIEFDIYWKSWHRSLAISKSCARIWGFGVWCLWMLWRGFWCIMRKSRRSHMIRKPSSLQCEQSDTHDDDARFLDSIKCFIFDLLDVNRSMVLWVGFAATLIFNHTMHNAVMKT